MLNNFPKVTQLGNAGTHPFLGHNDSDLEFLEFQCSSKFKIPQLLRS